MHVAAGARMVDFGGWDMPVGYGSQIEEHHAVRRDAGMFDVSHMCVVDLRGAGVAPLLLRLLANDVGRLAAPGKALYSCMLRPDGGVIDDLIACYLDENWFRVVVNAGTADKDLALDQGAREADRRRRRAAARPRDDRGTGPERAREGDAPLPAGGRARRRQRSALLRRGLRRVVRRRAPATPARTDSKSRCPRRRRGVLDRSCARPGSPPAVSARATRCGSRPA